MRVQHGLSQETVANINKVFAHFPKVEKAVLYGSRAKGTARSGSDIDLVLFGNEVDQETVDRIAVALDDLLLPYQFDLSIFSRISHADLLDHIQRVGVLFYEKSAVGTQI
jgi:predicted nucleotidyltransferase